MEGGGGIVNPKGCDGRSNSLRYEGLCLKALGIPPAGNGELSHLGRRVKYIHLSHKSSMISYFKYCAGCMATKEKGVAIRFQKED